MSTQYECSCGHKWQGTGWNGMCPKCNPAPPAMTSSPVTREAVNFEALVDNLTRAAYERGYGACLVAGAPPSHHDVNVARTRLLTSLAAERDQLRDEARALREAVLSLHEDVYRCDCEMCMDCYKRLKRFDADLDAALSTEGDAA